MQLTTPQLQHLCHATLGLRCPECGATAQRQLAFGAAPGRHRWRVECTDLDCSFRVLIERGPCGGVREVREHSDDHEATLPPGKACAVRACNGHRSKSGLCPNHQRKWKLGNPKLTLEEFVHTTNAVNRRGR